MRNIIKLTNQGFCYGVNHALEIAIKTVEDKSLPRPIYLLGNIVHNSFVEKYLTTLGIITIEGYNRLEMLDKVPDNVTLIFSAHGVSDVVRNKAKSKNLTIIDATCPYVEKTFKKVENSCNDGYEVLYIGKKNHPETEAVQELSKHVHLVNPDHIDQDNLTNNKIIIAHQTTMSYYDVSCIYQDILKVYPQAEKLDMICRATEKRQEELKNIIATHEKEHPLAIIIGDKNSNNSTKLYELARRSRNVTSFFIESISELNLDEVRKFSTIIIASGTSTPSEVINEVEKILNKLDTIKENHIESNININNISKY